MDERATSQAKSGGEAPLTCGSPVLARKDAGINIAILLNRIKNASDMAEKLERISSLAALERDTLKKYEHPVFELILSSDIAPSLRIYLILILVKNGFTITKIIHENMNTSRLIARINSMLEEMTSFINTEYRNIPASILTAYRQFKSSLVRDLIELLEKTTHTGLKFHLSETIRKHGGKEHLLRVAELLESNDETLLSHASYIFEKLFTRSVIIGDPA